MSEWDERAVERKLKEPVTREPTLRLPWLLEGSFLTLRSHRLSSHPRTLIVLYSSSTYGDSADALTPCAHPLRFDTRELRVDDSVDTSADQIV